MFVINVQCSLHEMQPLMFPFTFSSLAHPLSDHQRYKRDMVLILSSKKLLGIQKVLETQGIWSKDMMLTRRNWLLMEVPIVYPDETRRRWCRLGWRKNRASIKIKIFSNLYSSQNWNPSMRYSYIPPQTPRQWTIHPAIHPSLKHSHSPFSVFHKKWSVN